MFAGYWAPGEQKVCETSALGPGGVSAGTAHPELHSSNTSAVLAQGLHNVDALAWMVAGNETVDRVHGDY